MVCEHLQHLYQLCITQQIRLSSSELVHFVCHQCDSQDTCPTNLMDDEDQDEESEASVDNDSGDRPDES